MADEVQEVLRTSYSTGAFDLTAALSGALVGLIQDVSQLSSANISDNTGKLQKADGLTHYYVIIDGVTCWVNETGKVQHCVDGTKIGKTLVIVKANMVSTTGSRQQTTRSGGESYQDILAISSLEVRDTFAIYALQGLLQHTNNPESFDDAGILSMCGAAYKWAQGMMQASADKRTLIAKEEGGSGGEGGEGEDSGTTRGAVDVTEGTNTEKLLSNMVAAIDDLTAVQKKMLKTTGEGDSATTTLSIPSLKVEQPIKVDNAQEEGEDKEFKVSGGGGGSSLNRDDVNDAGSTITDVVVYNTAVGKAPLRATIDNFANKALSALGLNWLIKKGETSITDASSFFTQYKEEMATALADKFDAKGAASTAEANAKQYADDNFVRQ